MQLSFFFPVVLFIHFFFALSFIFFIDLEEFSCFNINPNISSLSNVCVVAYLFTFLIVSFHEQCINFNGGSSRFTNVPSKMSVS